MKANQLIKQLRTEREANLLSYLGLELEEDRPYERDKDLQEKYASGYYDGLDAKPGRNVKLEELSEEQRNAYVHGFVTGGDDARRGLIIG